jgi:hypothetical protein
LKVDQDKRNSPEHSIAESTTVSPSLAMTTGLLRGLLYLLRNINNSVPNDRVGIGKQRERGVYAAAVNVFYCMLNGGAAGDDLGKQAAV